MKKIFNKLDLYYFLIPLIVTLFSLPNLFKKDLGGDFLVYFIPHYSFIFSNLKSGDIPFWFPYSYLGLPEIFKSELAIFHPVTILIFIFDFLINPKNNLNILGNIIEVTWFAFLAVGGIGFYRLSSKCLGFDKFASFISSLVFCLNPLMLPTMNTIVFFGINILPWIFYNLINLVKNVNLQSFLGLVLSNYLLFATGYPYFYVYFFIAQISLVLVLNYKKLPIYLWSGLLSFLLSAFFLLPNLHIYSQSFRSNEGDSEFQLFTSNIPTRIVNVFNPMPFGNTYSELDPKSAFTSNGVSWGIFTLIYLFIGAVSFRKDKINMWLFGTFFIAIFYSFGGYMAASQFFGNIIPFVDKFRSHSISLSLTMFTGCLFIVIGIENTFKGERLKYIEYSFWGLTFLAFLGLSLVPIINPKFIETNLSQTLSISRFVFIMGFSLLTLYLTSKHRTKVFLCIGIVIMLLEFYFYFLNLNGHFSEISYKKNYEKNSLIPENSSEKLTRVFFDNNQFAYNSSLSKTFSYQGYETSTYKGWYSLQNKYGMLKSLQLSNVKYFVTTNPNWLQGNSEVKIIKNTSPIEKPSEVFVSSVKGLPFNSPKSTNTHYTYEISNTKDRFFLPESVEFCIQNCKKRTNLPDFVMVKNNDKNYTITNPKTDGVQIEIKSYKSSEIKLNVETPSESFIVASETWDRGWSIIVNQKESKLYQIDNLFRGFVVPSGKSQIVMSYSPPFLIQGVIATLFGIVLLVVSIIKFKFISNLRI